MLAAGQHHGRAVLGAYALHDDRRDTPARPAAATRTLPGTGTRTAPPTAGSPSAASPRPPARLLEGDRPRRHGQRRALRRRRQAHPRPRRRSTRSSTSTFRRETTDRWLPALEAADIFCAPVLNYQQLTCTSRSPPTATPSRWTTARRPDARHPHPDRLQRDARGLDAARAGARGAHGGGAARVRVRGRGD